MAKPSLLRNCQYAGSILTRSLSACTTSGSQSIPFGLPSHAAAGSVCPAPQDAVEAEPYGGSRCVVDGPFWRLGRLCSERSVRERSSENGHARPAAGEWLRVAGGNPMFLAQQRFAATARDKTARQLSRHPPSKTALEATTHPPTEALLQHRPTSREVPIPSATSCPDLLALADHIRTHGPQYSLRHVAAGISLLTQLPQIRPASAPGVAVSGITAAALPSGQPPHPGHALGGSGPAEEPGPDSADAAAATTPTTTALAEESPPPGPFGIRHQARALTATSTPDERLPVSPSSASSTPPPAAASNPDDARTTFTGSTGLSARPGAGPTTLAQCARHLGMLGHYAMCKETDIAALAACISGLAGLADEDLKAALALPFVERLRDAGYYYQLHTAPPAALVAVLRGLGSLNPWRYMDAARRKSHGQVLRRVVSCLGARVSCLSAEDAVEVTRAMARLHMPIHRHDVNRAFLKDLTAHLREQLLEQGLVSPGQAVRLLWAYGSLLPGAGSACDDAGPPPPAKKQPEGQDSPPHHRGDPRILRREEAGHLPPLDDEMVGQVAAVVTALARVACRRLGEHEPLELVRLVGAMASLRAQRDGEAVLQQATPVLLQKLPSLDSGALASLAHAYHTLRVKESGLAGAIADQILSSPAAKPLSARDLRLLMPCFGVGGTFRQPALWDHLRVRLAGALPTMNRIGLGEVLAALNPEDPDDARLAALVRERLQVLEQEEGTSGR